MFLSEYPHLEIEIHDSAKSAIQQADVLITCTVSDKPYIPFEWLKKGCFVSNISIMDIEPEVFLKVDKVIVDDWDQSNREKKVINVLVEDGLFSREKLHAELGDIIIGHKTVVNTKMKSFCSTQWAWRLMTLSALNGSSMPHKNKTLARFYRFYKNRNN